jgi:hypothetical protein
MAGNYFPDGDAEFTVWLTQFAAYANANLAALGLVAGDMAPLTAAQTAFNGSVTAKESARNAYANAVQASTTARANAEVAVRMLVRRLQASPTVTDAQRQSLGIPVRDRERTPKGAPTTPPQGSVDTTLRLAHTVAFRGANGKRGKPKEAVGCEIWVKVGEEPPVDPSECRFLALDTASPYVATYTGSDGGKTAHYLLRWTGAAGPGPWSETVSATIVG